MRLPKNARKLRPVRASAGIEAAYRKALLTLVRQMAEAYLVRLRAQWRRDPPEMAEDASPKRVTAVQLQAGGTPLWHAHVDGRILRAKNGAPRLFKNAAAAEEAGLKAAGLNGVLTVQVKAGDPRVPLEDLPLQSTPAENLEDLLSGMGERWQGRFDAAAPKLAEWFSRQVDQRSAQGLKSIMREAGATVRLQMTPELRDVARATIADNVSLIKSIQSQYHTEVEGLVMRSVARGRDLHFLTRELQKRYGITRRRAETIALQQNNAASSYMGQARQTAAGIEQGIWKHSHAGKTPRATHLANDGKVFYLKKGWYDPDPKVRRHILPGELNSCRCFWVPIVTGFFSAEAAE